MTLGERIKALREQHGWSQKTFWKLTGLRIGTLSSLEIGNNKNPRWSHLVRIAEAFGMEVHELLTDVDDIAKRKPEGRETPITLPPDPSTP